MSVWTLTHSATTKTFAEWGLKGLKRSRVSQAVGSASFIQSGAAYDGTPLFAEDDVVTISKDGAVWHTGPVTRVPREGAARSESLAYEVADPFWYLEQLPYQQLIAYGTGSGGSVSRVTLFGDTSEGSLAKLSVQQVIQAVIDYAVAQGASMQVAFAGSFGVSPAIQDMRDPTCAEVIRQALRFSPDATTSWDYSTTPPTLRIATRAGATARTVALDDQQSVNLIGITARQDLRRDKVVIRYEITSEDDGETWVDYAADTAGSGSPFRTLVATIPLSGSQTQRQRQYLRVASIPSNSATWWKRHVPHLNGATDLVLTGHAETPAEDGGDSYSNEILEGSVPGWLNEDSVSGPMRVTALATYKLIQADGSTVEFKDDPVSVVVQCTDMITAEYSRVSGGTDAEPVPTGVAAALHAALSVVQYDGRVRLKRREADFVASPGEVLNFTGGSTAWESIRAQVQKVEEDVDGGVVDVSFGPAKHLAPQDIVEMLRTLRGKPPSYQLGERTTGKKGGNDAATGTRGGGNDNGSAGAAHWKKVITKSADGTKILTLDAEAGVKLEKNDEFMDLDSANQRILLSDGAGKTMELTAEGISIQNAEGDSMTITFAQLLISQAAGPQTSLSSLSLAMDNGTATSELTNAQLDFDNGSDHAAIGSTQVAVSNASASAQLTPGELECTQGDAVANVSAVSGLAHTDGSGNTATLTGPDGLNLTDGTKTAEVSVTQVQLVDGAKTATISPEGGFANETADGEATLNTYVGVALAASGGQVVAMLPVASLTLSTGAGTVVIEPPSGAYVEIQDVVFKDASGDNANAKILCTTPESA